MADLSQYQDLFDQTEEKYQLPSGLLPVMAQTESGGNPRAVSDAGAAGLMQFTKPTADEVGIKDRFDPAQSVEGAGKYMRQLLDRYHGDKRKALAAYNYGMSHIPVDKPMDEAQLPQETRDYLRKTADRHDAISGNQPPAEEPAPETRKVNLIKNGVRFTANVPVDWSADQIKQHFQENPVPDSYLRGKAAEQGKYVDPETGAIKDYSNVQKFLIGAGQVANDVKQGTMQWIAQARGNADEVKRIAQQTAAEAEVYKGLDEHPGVGPEDVGQVLANAAVLFGPGGILGAAARAGIFETAKATEDETGDAAGRAGKGALAATAVGTLGGAGKLVGALVKKVGLTNVASIATPIIAEMTTGHGVLTAAAVVAMRRALGTGGGLPGKFASKFLGIAQKEAQNPVTAKLGQLATDGGTPEPARIAAAQLIQKRAEQRFAKLAAEQADAERKAQALVTEKLQPQAAPPPWARGKATPATVASGRAKALAEAQEPILPKAGPPAWARGAKAPPTRNPIDEEFDITSNLPTSNGPAWKQGADINSLTNAMKNLGVWTGE